LQVEDNLFKVPKRYFEKVSGIFGHILALPFDDGRSSDEEPIRLKGIKKVDIERLLGAIYPACVVTESNPAVQMTDRYLDATGTVGQAPSVAGNMRWNFPLCAIWEIYGR
jgi:hypothetical protein